MRVLADDEAEDAEYFELHLTDTDPQIRPLRDIGIASIAQRLVAPIFGNGFED